MGTAPLLSVMLLCVVWASEVVRMFYAAPWIAAIGGICLGTYMLMALGRSSPHIRVVFVLVVAASACIAWSLGAPNAMLAGFAKSQVFGAFLPAVLLLRATVEVSPRIAVLRGDLGRLEDQAAVNWTQYGAHALGAVLNVGATAILAPVVAKEAGPAERAELARSSARGVGGAVLWSPFFPALAFTSQLVAEFPMWHAMLVGGGMALIGFGLSYYLFTRSLGWRGFRASIGRLRPLVAPMLLVIGAVVGATIAFPWNGLQAVALVVPLLCVAYLGGRGGPDSRKVMERAAFSFSRLSDELLILIGASVLGACIAALPAARELGSNLTPAMLSGPVLLAVLVLTLLALGQVGLHPMIGASIAVPIVALGGFGICDVVLVSTVVFAWALNGSTSIWALPVAAGANLFGIPAAQMLSWRTVLFVLLYVIAGLAYLSIANYALARIGC